MATETRIALDAGPPPPRPAERRQVTVLFADLVGSTAMMEELGPDAYSERLRLFHAICTEAVRRRGGAVAQYQGDGLIATFGHPLAAEDDAERGVGAALDLVAGLARDGGGLGGRVGVATGPALLRGEGDPFGEAAVGACLNRAARLEAMAPAGAVLVCAATHRLVGGLFETRRLGDAELRGFSRREPVHRVTGRRAGVRSRFEALRAAHALPLVGREAELARLLGLARGARAGRGGAAVVSAEPGMGKSRLVAALREHPEAERLRAFVLQCAPEHAATPLHPVREYLEWVAGATRGDGPEARHAKLGRLFEQVWRAGRDEAGWLLDELSPLGSGVAGDESLSVPLRRRRALETLARMILRSAAGREAVLCVFEDAQWMDPSTSLLVRVLAGAARDQPLLLLLTTRPEPPFGDGAEGMELMRLDRLDAPASADLARAAMPPALPPALTDLVLGKADGVPLFIEEYAETIAQAVAAGRPPEEIDVPPTLGALVQGRFDRLDPLTRRLGQGAAALGRRADWRLAAAAAGLSEAEARGAALALESARLARTVEPDRAIEFGHALVRDAVYGTLDGAGRRALHGRIADHWLDGEAQVADEVLADHLHRAGRPAAAIDRWRRAALAAAGVGAAFEALAHLTLALRATEGLPPGEARDRHELGLRAVLGPALMVTGGPGSPAFGASQARAVELMGDGAIDPGLVPVIFNWALHLWARARHAEALDTVRLLDRAAEDGGDDASRLAAGTMRGLVSWHMGRNEAAKESLEATLRLYDAERHRDIYANFLMEFGVFGRFYLALAETVTGQAARGAHRAEAALELAERVRRPHAVGFALMANVMTALLRDDAGAAARWSARGLDFAAAQGFPEFAAMSRFVGGWAACREGRLDEGLSAMAAGADGWDATGFLAWQPLMAAERARMLVAAGELAPAEALLDACEARVGATGEAQAEAPLRLARARLLLARGDAAAARVQARAAAAAARAQKARSWLDRVEASGLLG